MTLAVPERNALRDLLKQNVLDTGAEPPRRSRRVLVAASVAGPVAAAVIVASILVPGASSAQAAEMLRGAARSTIVTSDLAVASGQFLKVTTEAAYLAYESDAHNHLTAYLSPSKTEVWVPADNADNWVQRETAQRAIAFYGAESRIAADRDWASTVKGGIERITRAANGEFVKVTELGGDVDLGALPDTPESVLAYLRSTPDSSDEGAFSFAAQLLRDATLKAPQRALIYEALALLPGIRISDDKAVLDGRTGTAFSLKPTGTLDLLELIIDPATGRYIGEREVTTVRQGAVPAGTNVSYTAVSSRVVDSAP